MRKYSFLLVSVLLAFVATSCGDIFGPKPDPAYDEADIIGTWQTASEADDATANDHLVYVFLPEQSTGSQSGRWGYSYDEGDDVHDDDLWNDEHGNGWFIWHLDAKVLKTLEVNTASAAMEPYDYDIVALTDTTMVLRHNTNTWKLERID